MGSTVQKCNEMAFGCSSLEKHSIAKCASEIKMFMQLITGQQGRLLGKIGSDSIKKFSIVFFIFYSLTCSKNKNRRQPFLWWDVDESLATTLIVTL